MKETVNERRVITSGDIDLLKHLQEDSAPK
jgi:hypothetical protein